MLMVFHRTACHTYWQWLAIVQSLVLASFSVLVVGAFSTTTLHCTHNVLYVSSHRYGYKYDGCSLKLKPGVDSEDDVYDGEGLISQVVSKQDEHKYWTLPRLFVGAPENEANLPLIPGALIPLTPGQKSYLTNVMRIFKKKKRMSEDESDGNMTAGRDCIRIFNGEHGEWLAKVLAPSDHEDESSGKMVRARRQKQNRDVSLVAECIEQLRPQTSNVGMPWILFVPLKKQPRMKIMIEKCTELGVGRIVPVASDLVEGGALAALLGSSGNKKGANLDAVYGGHSNNSQGDDGNELSFGKLALQAVEAAEQSERLTVPLITNDVELTESKSSHDTLWNVRDLVEQWDNDWDEQTLKDKKRVLLICRERGTKGNAGDGRARVVPVIEALRDNQQVAFLVGPEGGWSTEEEKIFDEICAKHDGKDGAPIQSVSLGSSVLRAETASLMAVGAWSLAKDSW